MSQPLLFLVTGGTFDKAYDEIKGQLFFETTHLPEMLSWARNRVPYEIRTLMMVDSLLMTDAQRQDIVATCLNCPHNRIIITHGTDTMTLTGKAIAEQLPKDTNQKTIILTGAMIPHKFGSSDGLFNLGAAIAYVQVNQPGVYVVMNGQCFPWNDVRKDLSTGQFVRLATDSNSSGS